MIPSTARCFLGYICDSDSQAFLLPQDKKDRFAELSEAILGRKKAFLLKHSKSLPVKLHLLPSSFQHPSYTLILCIRLVLGLLRLPLGKLNCLIPFERKFPTNVSSIAGKVSCLGAMSLAYRFSCF